MRRSLISTVRIHQVWRSLISTVHLLQVHCSLISNECLIKCNVHKFPLCTFYKCTIHQSTVLRLYKGCTNLHCCSVTVAPVYSIAPFVSYYFMICDYATHQLCDYATLNSTFYIINNLATDVNMPRRLFNCIIEI